MDQQARTTSLVTVQTYTETTAFEHLREGWNSLLHESASDDVFLTWEWQATWWDAYHPGELHILAVHNADNRLIGIAPWFLVNGIAHTIGCEDVTDYLDMIAHRDYEAAVYEALADYLAEHSEQVTRLELCNIPANSPTLEGFRLALQADNFDVEIEQNEVCPVIELPEQFEQYFDLLDKKQRHELRRKMRRAMGADETIDWYVVTEGHDFAQEIEDFLVLMAQSDSEKERFLQDPNNSEFFRQVMPILRANGWLKLFVMTVNGAKAAAYLCFDYNNRLLVYNSGLAMKEFGHLSPGIVLLANIIQYAIEKGYRLFDFLRGDEIYKYYMGAKDTAVYKLTANFISQRG